MSEAKGSMMQDRFTQPKPIFKAPTNATALEAMASKPKETTPAPSVVQRVQGTGRIDLASLLEAMQQDAKKNAKVIEREKKPRQPRKSKGETTSVQVQVPTLVPKFQPSDVVSDEEFIKRTRHTDIHTPEMKVLFYANGGDHFLVGETTYAQAWDMLRKEKMFRLSVPKGVELAQAKPYHRHSQVPTGSQVVVPGMPTQQDYARRQEAIERARRTSTNEKWAGISK